MERRDRRHIPTAVSGARQANNPLESERDVYGVESSVNGQKVYVAFENLNDLRVPGRAAAVISHAATVLGDNAAESIIVLCQNHVETDYYEARPEIIRDALSALEAAKHGKVWEPLVLDRRDSDREWTYYHMVELHPDRNAVLIRQGDPAREIGVELGKVREDGSCKDSLGIFPRFTIGQNKDVFAFRPADTLPVNQVE